MHPTIFKESSHFNCHVSCTSLFHLIVQSHSTDIIFFSFSLSNAVQIYKRRVRIKALVSLFLSLLDTPLTHLVSEKNKYTSLQLMARRDKIPNDLCETFKNKAWTGFEIGKCCSTSLLLASTRWVRLTLLSLCPLF